MLAYLIEPRRREGHKDSRRLRPLSALRAFARVLPVFVLPSCPSRLRGSPLSGEKRADYSRSRPPRPCRTLSPPSPSFSVSTPRAHVPQPLLLSRRPRRILRPL